jgi:hypothetical protein
VSVLLRALLKMEAPAPVPDYGWGNHRGRTLTQCSGCDSMADMPHKAPIPGWVWRLRIETALKKRPRLVLANKIADLRALPKVQQPAKLPKDVLKLAPSPSLADDAPKPCCR